MNRSLGGDKYMKKLKDTFMIIRNANTLGPWRLEIYKLKKSY